MDSYLESIKKQFLYYKMLGEKAMEQLQEEQLFWQYNEESNSIAILVNHIAGNMYDEVNEKGILIQKYGPHFLNTNYWWII